MPILKFWEVLGESNINNTLIKTLPNLYGSTTQVETGKKLSHPSGFTTNLMHFFHGFQRIYFSTSTCFKRQALIIRREQLYQYILWYNTLAR
jgi:hypothetical protein